MNMRAMNMPESERHLQILEQALLVSEVVRLRALDALEHGRPDEAWRILSGEYLTL